MNFDQEIWRGLIDRLKPKIHKDRPHYRTIYYSVDMDRYLDSDNPGEEIATTTIREELRKLGIIAFVRLPESTGLTNYIDVGYNVNQAFLS